MPLQPAILPEGPYTDVERHFIELSPDGLWPENQDSNFGQFRKVLTDILQECVDEIDSLGDERFIDSATRYLSLWEEELAVPVATAGKTDQQRRAILVPRIQYGPFTSAKARAVVESYLGATFGEAASFGAGGITLTVGGVPLYAGITDLAGLFRIYWNPRTFSYEVWVISTITPDTSNMTKELTRLTPAGITFTIDNTHANVFDYFREVRSLQPVAYYRLGANFNDSSGYANNGAGNGGVVAGSGPTLVNPAVAAADTATDFDGVDDYVGVPFATQLNVGDHFTAMAWIRVDSLAADGTILVNHTGSVELFVNVAGRIRITNSNVGDYEFSTDPVIVPGLTYFIAYTNKLGIHKLYVNGQEIPITGNASQPPFSDIDTAAFLIGTHYTGRKFNGVIDEVALLNYALSEEQVEALWYVGTNQILAANQLVVSGNEITDATRAAGTSGDGRLNDSSFGLWEATTNLVTNGGFETNATGWQGRGTGVTITRVTTDAKFGSACLQVFVPVSTDATWGLSTLTPFTVSPNTIYTMSAWVKGPAGKRVQFWYMDQTGLGLGAAPYVTLTGEWQRITYTVTTHATMTGMHIAIAPNTADTPLTFWVDAVQLEQQPLATPYVATDGATNVRGASRVEAPAALIDKTQAWVAMRVRMGFPSTIGTPGISPTRLFEWSDFNNAQGWIGVSLDTSTFQLNRRVEGSGDAAANQVVAFVKDDILTIVAAWTASSVKISVNGAPFAVYSGPQFIGTMLDTRFDIGGGQAPTLYSLDSDVLWFACGKGVLMDADAAAIHAFGNADKQRLEFPGQCTAVMPMKTSYYQV